MQLQDIDIRFFKNDLVNFINSNPNPLEVKRLVIKEVLVEVSEAADSVIKQQKQVREVQTKPVLEEPTKEIEENEEETEE